MDQQKLILCDLGEHSWESDNGGRHRTMQLHELFARAGYRIETLVRDADCSNGAKYIHGLRALIQSGMAFPSPGRLLRHHGTAYARCAPHLSKNRKASTFSWEDTHCNNSALPFLMRRAGYKVVASPQNLEALIHWELHSRKNTWQLRAEMTALKNADAIFCISSEEQWLLALFGMQADFLPYHPPRYVREQMQAIRSLRETSQKTRMLIMGSAGNPPTRQGMIHLLEILKRHPTVAALPLDIVGYGTETLKNEIAGTGFRIHGGVNSETLERLLIESKAVICHQKRGIGALTRIPEMLWAGIPVITNPIAGRSAFMYDGVNTYNSPQELMELLDHTLPVPTSPPAPTKAEARFIEAISTARTD